VLQAVNYQYPDSLQDLLAVALINALNESQSDAGAVKPLRKCR
jgi:hypothetical protein